MNAIILPLLLFQGRKNLLHNCPFIINFVVCVLRFILLFIIVHACLYIIIFINVNVYAEMCTYFMLKNRLYHKRYYDYVHIQYRSIIPIPWLRLGSIFFNTSLSLLIVVCNLILRHEDIFPCTRC